MSDCGHPQHGVPGRNCGCVPSTAISLLPTYGEAFQFARRLSGQVLRSDTYRNDLEVGPAFRTLTHLVSTLTHELSCTPDQLVERLRVLLYQSDVAQLRGLAWQYHSAADPDDGHHLYGDDGELQCQSPDGNCDFKRDPVAHILEHVQRREDRLAAELLGGGGQR